MTKTKLNGAVAVNLARSREAENIAKSVIESELEPIYSLFLSKSFAVALRNVCRRGWPQL